MRRIATQLFGVALVICGASVGHATQYPPGPVPPGTCTDTLIVFGVQNISATCHPAIGDTVNGVAGICTGFDTFPSGFAIYIQNNAVGANGTPWTGIDVFTETKNFVPLLGLARGDSIIVELGKID